MMRTQILPSVLVASFLLLSGCSNNSNVNSGNLDDGNSKPFVEGYIEYPGPHEKWTGPQSFVIHVETSDSAVAKISISPAMSKAVPRQTISSEAAREQLARLNTALASKETPFQGCLSPVRIKLIRIDGVLVERQACRGAAGWPRVASEVSNHFIETWLKKPILGFPSTPIPGS